MDLHAWITQQVDRVEAAAHARLKGLRVAFEPNDDGPTITGTVTEATRAAGGLQLDVAQYGAEPVDDAWATVPQVADILRRCEADRRVLARHRRDPDCLAWAACKGCGNDDWGLPNVENQNDCPELLDLAHAHGLTEEILASLDRPQPSESKPVFGGILTLPITTRDVPEALRGPRWKP
ncbi:MAG: hypothetical protein ACJ71Y_11450 [Blastococcus sp.]|jgi:hypothetical protein